MKESIKLINNKNIHPIIQDKNNEIIQDKKKKEVKEEHINNNTSDSDGKLLDHKEILSGDNSNLRMNSKKRKFEKENNSDAKELEFI